jgi:hypothetical protein
MKHILNWRMLVIFVAEKCLLFQVGLPALENELRLVDFFQYFVENAFNTFKHSCQGKGTETKAYSCNFRFRTMKLPICLEKEALPVYIEQGVWRQGLKWLSKWYTRIFYFPIISVAVLNFILTKVSKFKLAWYLISSQIKQDWKCVICTRIYTYFINFECFLLKLKKFHTMHIWHNPYHQYRPLA